MQEQEAIKEARAQLKFARISARKVKIVADLVRGKNVDEALAIMKFTPKASSPILEKLLKSAIASARDMSHEKFYISEIYFPRISLAPCFEPSSAHPNRGCPDFHNCLSSRSMTSAM